MPNREGHAGSIRREQFAIPKACLIGLATALPLTVALPGIAVTRATAPPHLAAYARPATIPFPADNQYTDARAQLGKTLFFDPRLSGSGWISCASCHNPALSWSDGLAKGYGHGMRTLGRRTPTVQNLAWTPALFWDGRAESLEEQALGPIAAEGEMNLPLNQVAPKLRSIPGYLPLFQKAYPGEPVGPRTVAKALATYERTLISGEAPFDRWVRGDERALSDPAKRGFSLFVGKAGCAKCHSEWRFSDDSFHNIGLGGSDPGRGALLPDIEILQRAFKTPTLRNVAERAPYFHDGSATTLEEVVDHYNQGGRVRGASLSREIVPLGLSSGEKRDLIVFLKSLSDQPRPVTVPQLPR